MLISWLMPATSWPSEDIFSACTSCTCDSLRSASVPLSSCVRARDALLERFVEHGEVGVGAIDLAIAAVQPQRDETHGEQQHDGIDGEHQPRLLDARNGDRVQVLGRRAERRAWSPTGVPTSCLSLLSMSGLFVRIVPTEFSSTSTSPGIVSTR